MSLPEAFYRELSAGKPGVGKPGVGKPGAGTFESTSATVGPWSADLQHAGPPSALLGRAMRQCAPRPELRIARVTLDIPRPIPVAELVVDARVVRSTSRTELVEGEITSDGRQVLVARAWRIARGPADTPELRPRPKAPSPAEAAVSNKGYTSGYAGAIEWRFLDGGFDVAGPGTCWARQRIPLVAGQDDTGLCRALVLADSSWAVGNGLDHTRQQAINTDITLALHREPAGEWFCLGSEMASSPDGSALAEGSIADTEGDCGRVLQTLLVADG